MTDVGRRVAWILLAALVAAPAAAAAVAVHQLWWGLGLGGLAGLVTLLWMPGGAPRITFAAVWGVVVARATVVRPEGDYLVSASGRGWGLLLLTLLLVALALTTWQRPRADRDDQGSRGGST